MADTHLLRTLQLPARYEPLVNRIGEEVAQLLVEPGLGTRTSLERAALSVRARGEGLLVPLYGPSGTGKTTLANNLIGFSPNEFAGSVVHRGEVSSDVLLATVDANPPGRNDRRIVPIVIDDRESAPPTEIEMAAMKRFLREPKYGNRSVILWPETSLEQATAISEAYIAIAGAAPIDLPLRVEGPSREAWVDIALHTLRLSNDMIDDLEQLGVDPRMYDVEAFETIGAYLRRISDDFTEFVARLLAEQRIPARLVVAFCSESQNAGVLAGLTGGTRYGLLDAAALLDSTSQSVIGRYWGTRRGALTQTIVRLDARAVCLPPPATIGILRRHGSAEVQQALADLGVEDRGPARLVEVLRRTDLGELLRGTGRAAFEARGTPATTALTAFQIVAESGFNLGRDKPYNRAVSDALGAYLLAEAIAGTAEPPETRLAGSQLVPDNSLSIGGGEYLLCLEYTWRSGDFLTMAHRSDVAQYILTKLKNYAVGLGWLEA